MRNAVVVPACNCELARDAAPSLACCQKGPGSLLIAHRGDGVGRSREREQPPGHLVSFVPIVACADGDHNVPPSVARVLLGLAEAG
jgi:hypothetical protein